MWGQEEGVRRGPRTKAEEAARAKLKERLTANPELARKLLQAKREQEREKTPLYRMQTAPETFLFDKQVAVLKSPDRRRAILTSRRAGKTTLLAYFLIQKVLENPGLNIPYVCMTREAGRNILWPVVFEMCERLGVTVRGNSNSGDLSFPETRNRILVRGLDNDSQLNKLRGNKFPGAVIDEAQHLGGDLSGFIDDVLEPALIDLGGEILLCGTPGELPVGPFYEITEAGRPGWQVFRWTLRDNPYLLTGNAQFSDADELLADIRRSKGWTDKNPTYLREYTGVWAASNDIGVYELKAGSVCPASDLPAPEADDQWGLGIDLGYQSDSAFVVLRFNRRLGTMIAIESHSQGKMLVGDVARRIKEYEARYDLSFTVADAGGYGQSIVQALRLDYGMHVHSAVKDDKAGIIRRLNDALANHRLRISDECHDLVDQMSKLQWSRSHLQGGKRVENKKSSPNHATDALLYAFRHAAVGAGDWDVQGPEVGTPSYVDQQIEEYWEEREREMANVDDFDGWTGVY